MPLSANPNRSRTVLRPPSQAISLHSLGSAARLHPYRHAIRPLLQAHHPAGPAQARALAVAAHGFMRIFLDIVLLDVHHGRKTLRGIVRHIEMQHLAGAEVTAAGSPAQALVHQRPVGAEPAQDLLRAARHTDGLRLNLPAIVGYYDEKLMRNLIDAAVRVRSASQRQVHFILVLRSDSTQRIDDMRRVFRSRALEAAIPVYDEMPDAAYAPARIDQLERFRATAWGH